MAEGNCQPGIWISNYSLAWAKIDQEISFKLWKVHLREGFGSLDLMEMRSRLLVASFFFQQRFSESFKL